MDKLKDVELLSYGAYETHLDKMLSSAQTLDNSNYADCVNDKGLGYYLPDNSGYVLTPGDERW